MTIQVMHEQEEHRRTGENVDETIYFESTGWWGRIRREGNKWSMITTSGGQNGVDVLEQIQQMKEMLEYAEKVIVEQPFKRWRLCNG